MDLMHLRVFQRQAALQCKYILKAATEVNDDLKKGDIDGLFYRLQNLLTAAANVSKAFWGSGGKLSDERKPLRDSIGIDDSSPIREVTMRNNFDHYDERLDRWWKESKRHNHISQVIGPKNAIGGVDEIDKFKHFDPKTTDMFFWGQEFNLQAIVNEARRILPLLEAEANKPHWETKPKEPQA